MELRYSYISCRVVKAIAFTQFLDQVVQQIPTSNEWMDWQKNPQDKNWIRIQQIKTLDWKTCLTFPGMRVQHLVAAFHVFEISSLFFFCQRFSFRQPATTSFIALCNGIESGIMHDSNSETRDPCNSESELKSQTWLSAHVTVTKSGQHKHCRGRDPEWPAQALPWQSAWQGPSTSWLAGLALPVLRQTSRYDTSLQV